MPFQRSPAVCLRKIDFSESSQVLRFFTRDQGKVSCIAKGAKRRKGSFDAPFDLLGLYDLVRIEKRPGTLDIVTEAKLLRAFTGLRADYARYVTACYAAEFSDEFTEEGLGVPRLYDLLVEALERLEEGRPVPDVLFSFEARALAALGYAPRARECGVCRRPVGSQEAYFSVRDGGAVCVACRPRNDTWFPVRRASLESIARFSEGQMPREEVKVPLARELRQIFDVCIRFHLERELKSSRFVKEILERIRCA